MTPRHVLPLLPLLCAAAAGCTGALWGDALRTHVRHPEAEGVITAAAPGGPGRLFVRYTDDLADLVQRPTVFVVAPVTPSCGGGAPVVRAADARRISCGMLERAKKHPRWRSLSSDYLGAEDLVVGADGQEEDVTRLRLRGITRLKTGHNALPPSGAANKRQDPPPRGDAQWEQLVLYVPSSVPRRLSSRITGLATAVVLSPAAVLGDALVAPLLLVNVLMGVR